MLKLSPTQVSVPVQLPVSLGTLFLAALLADLCWLTLLLPGMERVEIKSCLLAASSLDFVYYFSHSLLTQLPMVHRRLLAKGDLFAMVIPGFPDWNRVGLLGNIL